jgi:hypothetical protein
MRGIASAISTAAVITRPLGVRSAGSPGQLAALGG